MSRSLIFLLFLVSLATGNPASSTPSGPQADLITDLPGLNFKIDFKQYSGYLDATEGRKLHYWFVESERSPSEDPLVLWMNGGPGCSSLAGLLTEQGPFRVNRSDPRQLLLNDYRWNQVANVIFLEAPAGVGFSYIENGEDYTTDDDQVAKDNHKAILAFFEKFPHFKSNPFFVTGESYGGIYVPTLAQRILRNSPDINLQGFAIGNGYLDREKLGNSLILFGYFHGVFGRTIWTNLVKSCCNFGNVSQSQMLLVDPMSKPQGCQFVDNPNKACTTAVKAAIANIRSNDINIYNLYKKCDFPEEMVERMNTVHDRLIYANVSFGKSREHHAKKLLFNIFGHDEQLVNSIKDSPPCIDDTYVGKYLNQRSVRTALHIPPHVQDWEICSADVESTYTIKYKTMKPQILELLKAEKRGLIYNGDVDMACNFLGDEWFVDDLGLPLVSDYKEWHLKSQVAGYVKHFNNLVYATVKGSGHMVPEDQPEAALALIVGFLE